MSQYKVMWLSVNGSETWADATSEQHAMKLAKSMRTQRNHTVIIDSDGTPLLRWDRPNIRGENRWRRCKPDEVMILGPVREMIRAHRPMNE